jgi:filamentous hemagglutinin family protein
VIVAKKTVGTEMVIKILRNEDLITSKTFESNLPGFKNLAGLILGFIESSFLITKQIIWKTTVLVIMLTACSLSLAEVVLDGTLGQQGILQGVDVKQRIVFPITEDLGQQFGNNLFHSFERFNLNFNEIAHFSGSNTIENVISRVTGGEASYINGGIQSTMLKADMYFLNPAGIIFGATARLNVQGSFYASTADYLRLGENGRFNATHPEQSLLKVAPPTAFGFLTESPATISKQGGFLFVPPEKTLSFIGGDLTLQNGWMAVGKLDLKKGSWTPGGGQVNLVSVASPGEVLVNPQKMPDNAFERFGKITITDTTMGADNLDLKKRPIANVDVSGAGGGEVYIRGGQIFLENGYVWADTLAHQNGQGITIKASEELRLSKGSRITAQVVKHAPTNFFIPNGNAGNITIEAERISITDGSEIDSTTQPGTAGNAGNVTISADKSIEIAGVFPINGYESGIHSQTAGSGKGGEITVSTSTLIMKDNGVIRAETQNFGDAGNISIKVDTLTLTEGATIRSSSHREGNAGTINITVGNMALHHAAITTQSEQSAGGDITIKIQDRLYLTNSKIKTSAEGLEKRDSGGNIMLSKPDFLILGGNSKLLTTGFVGDGGNIKVIAAQFIKSSDSRLDASSILGINGEITIDSSVEDFSDIEILPSTFRKRANLRLNRCNVNSSKETTSSFKLGTRHGLLVSPDELQR